MSDVRFNDQGGGRLACAAAICLAECQKLVSELIYVSLAPATEIRSCLEFLKTCACLADHSWRSLGDKIRLESAEPKMHPHDVDEIERTE